MENAATQIQDGLWVRSKLNGIIPIYQYHMTTKSTTIRIIDLFNFKAPFLVKVKVIHTIITIYMLL